jgi:hypothetical protein
MSRPRFIIPAAAALAVMLCLAATPARTADIEEMVVEASSPISLDDARRQALRQAVEQVAGVMLHSETEVRNFAVHKDAILQRTDGYVASYDTLNSRRSQAGLYQVKLAVRVSREPLKNDLMAMEILLENLERPRLMVLVEEDGSAAGLRNMRLAQTEINALLVDKGFDLVDQETLQAARRRGQARKALAGDLDAAKALGAQAGAQYVILGKAQAADAGEAVPGTGMRSMHANLQLKIVNTQNGELLGAVAEKGVAAHVSGSTGASLALRKAAAKAVDGYVSETIMRSFQDQLNNGIPITLHARGVDAFADYKRLAGSIESLDRTVSCAKRSWSKAGGLLVLDLRFRGTSEELAMILDGAKLGPRRVVIEDFAPNRLDVALE